MRRVNYIDSELSNIQVILINLELCEEQPNLSLNCFSNHHMYVMNFFNISNLNIHDFSFPFQIQGFEILSNKGKGWQKELSYTIQDFEDNILSFYCEDFEIFVVE